MSRMSVASLFSFVVWLPGMCEQHVSMSRSDLYREILRQTAAWDDSVFTKRHRRPPGVGITLYSSYTPFSSNEGSDHSQPSTCSAAAILEEDRRLSCGPHKTIVSLPPGPTDVIRVPELAELNRCQGSCYQRGLYCKPVLTRQVTLPVLHVNMSSGRAVVQCAEVTVTVHDRCRCSCAVRPSHCSDKQVYSYGDCSCKCSNMTEALECMARNKEWDPSSCTCGCPHTLSCSTGFYFDTSACRCQLVPQDAS